MLRAIGIFLGVFFVVSTLATIAGGMIGFKGLTPPYVYVYWLITWSDNLGTLTRKYGFGAEVISFIFALVMLWISAHIAYLEYLNPSASKDK